ncbi:glycosyltransferase [Synechococcus sp. RS9902]|uniref:glycosyltransferase n=1 Tax=Synechococcus sp. RS9902 TaxID=221345 RepID=UPI0016489170|nr:glycosyltransferase [Synechococcus sp. RS9902]QNI96563.1 putative beta-glycosyltransferase/ family 2 [Synechococcus sp. RS9902]
MEPFQFNCIQSFPQAASSGGTNFYSAIRPCVSVMMPCLNAAPFLNDAVSSVLEQTACLELLVSDGGSTDGSLEELERWHLIDPRVKIVSRSDSGPADGLNKAFKAARGTFIGWLNADDLYPLGALARAVSAFDAHPHWLMLYGEGEEFNSVSGLQRRYPTFPPSVGIGRFRFHCFICQPSVVFRRSMGLMLGPFDGHLRTSFDFDYWLRAFAAFPHRIGYVPHLQGRTRLHDQTITNTQRSRVALEATELIARHFGSAPATRLHNLGLELQLGLAETKPGQSQTELLRELTDQVAPLLDPEELENFRHNWQLNDHQLGKARISSKPFHGNTAPEQPIALRLLQALHPQLNPEAPGSPVERHLRLQQFLDNNSKRYHLLNIDNLSSLEQPASRGICALKRTRPFGVNLIGHAFEVFGIGEDIRMAARALESAGVPCCVIHYPAGNGAACIDLSLEHLVCSDPNCGPYAFNLVCMAAPIQARWLLEMGFDQLYERYTIASWPWETRQWPGVWEPLFDVVDEVWPSSTFTAHALQEPAAMAGVPMRVMPMAAEISDPEHFCSPTTRQATRDHLGLPSDALVFVYSFDLNSTAIRKNPMAALQAFQQAFPLPQLLSSQGRFPNTHPLSERVVLLIKTFPPRNFDPEWNWLQLRAQEDHRIHLLEAHLDRNALLATFGCCDVFLSLHRSEGFGRGLAEALQLGLDVIATDYGGHTDFCNGPLSHPVRCLEVPIPHDTYPFADGHYWGDPDLDHAVQLMQDVAERRINLAVNSNNYYANITSNCKILTDYRERFSLSSVGERYKDRLRQLWSD